MNNEQEHRWNRPLAVILNCAFKVFLEICQNIPQDLRCFKKSLYFQSIYTREISLKSVLANACYGSFLSPIRHWSIRLLGSIGKWRNLQEWTSVTDSWTVGLNMGELAMKLYFLILCSKTYKRFSWKSCKMESALPTKSLPQSWSVMLRHGPPKNKEKSEKTVSELDCHAELYGFWIVYKRWVPNGWLKLESASPIKSLPQSWSVMPRHGPPKKQREECENCFGTGLSCWAVGILNCVQEMGDKRLTHTGVGFTR